VRVKGKKKLAELKEGLTRKHRCNRVPVNLKGIWGGKGGKRGQSISESDRKKKEKKRKFDEDQIIASKKTSKK